MDQDQNPSGFHLSVLVERLRGHRYVLGAGLLGCLIFWLLGTFGAFALILFAGVMVLATLVPSGNQPAARERVSIRQQGVHPMSGSMRPLIDGIPIPCLLIDSDDLILIANKQAEQQFPNISEGNPVSFGIRAPVLLDALKNVQRSGEAGVAEWDEKSGAERWYRARISPVQQTGVNAVSAHNLHHTIILITDLTEQKRSETMRADFVANVSHELRTPLASLTGFIETLQGPARDDQAAQIRFLGVMSDQADRMSRLIDDLLSLSRIEMREHISPTGKVDLTNVIGHVCDTLSPLANDLGMTLEFSKDGSPGPVAGERDDLVQVFNNLIENSLKYGEEGKRVKISIEDAKLNAMPAYSISIQDWGPGIATDHIPRLQERFYRVDTAQSRAKKGTGLGLAIVKHILTSHRGRLEISSKPGEGATFRVLLPVYDQTTLPRHASSDRDDSVF